MKEKENNLNNTVKDLQKEIKEISKYFKNKLNPDEDKEKELKSYNCVREIRKDNKDYRNKEEKGTPQGQIQDILTLGITIYLYKERIKVKINEIQDNLKTNYLVYESVFVINDFHKVGEYYVKFGGIEDIYNFICELFENNKDLLIKSDNDDKIIIKLKFPCGLKEEEIELEILNKELSLDNTLKNFQKSINYLNKENKNIKDNFSFDNKKIIDEIQNLKNENNKMKKEIQEIHTDNYKLKIEFQKDLLEKVYPVGSYYWSEKNISPEELFGGKWTQIKGRFLFSSDNSHSVGSSGGEERVTLSLNEIPSHCHNYDRFRYYSYTSHDLPGSNYYVLYYPKNDTTFYSTYSTSYSGGNNSHNKMPPYITANCWRRTS